MEMLLSPPRMTRDDFFTWADAYAEDKKYEFDGVRPVATTGGMLNHSRIIQSLCFALRSRLLGSASEVLAQDAGVATIGNAVRYSDAVVTCTKGAGMDRLVPDAVAVFEVLSPTSGRNDRIDKLREYRAVPSIRHYTILEFASVALTSFRRMSDADDWTAGALLADDILELPEVGIQAPISEFYAGVDLPPDPEPEA